MDQLYWRISSSLEQSIGSSTLDEMRFPLFTASMAVANGLREYFAADPATAISDLGGKSIRKKVRDPRSSREHYRHEQARSLERVTRYYQRWASWEMKLASDYSLSATEVSRLTGRTYAAISRKRAKLRLDAIP